MIYNVNLGIGWASSGVEYAQAYRAQLFRKQEIEAKFIFMEMIQSDNIIHFTRNIGFNDSEVLWLYQYFSDIPLGPTTVTMDDILAQWNHKLVRMENTGNSIRCYFEGDFFVSFYFAKDSTELVHRAEFVINGNLIRKDFYSSQRVFSEFYTPVDGMAKVYQRRFYNLDGSTAYDEIIDGKDHSIFKFPNRICYSYEEFVEYFIQSLQLTESDFVIIDRATTVGAPILRNHGKAKLMTVVHAEHYSADKMDDHYILWNNYYEYEFSHANHIDAFINSTDAQTETLKQQFSKYTNYRPKVVTIPVGAIEKLNVPTQARKKASLITASRLASEKHIDWIIPAVVNAKKQIPELSLDIYGTGGEEEKLKQLIEENNAQEYIRLMGHHDLSEVYMNYEGYISASTSEGFGLTLLEAVASGLAMIGFDVPYGNPTFIQNGENGVLIPKSALETVPQTIEALTNAIVEVFEKESLDSIHEVSYEKASEYLSDKIALRWKQLIEEVLK